MSKQTCYDCRLSLEKNEISLSKKLLGRDTIGYLCINCLADYLSCSVSDLEDKIEEFKEQGCTLF